MKPRFLLLLFVFSPWLTGEELELALPQWGPVDSTLYGNESPLTPPLGGGLWPGDLYPLPLPPSDDEISQARALLEARLAEGPLEETGEAVARIIVADGASPERPDDLLPEDYGEPNNMAEAAHPPADIQPEVPAMELTMEQISRRFSVKPDSFIVDVDGLLSDERRSTLGRFLSFHSSDAAIPLYVVLLRQEERLPASFELHAVADKWFSNQMGCLVVYTLNDPRRAEIALSSMARNSAGSSREAVLSSQATSDALVVSQPEEQLDRFMAQVSVRLFWLEKTMQRDESVAGEEPEIMVASPIGPRRDLRQPLLFGLGLVATAFLGVMVFRWWRLKASPQKVWVFPDRECPVRLGAPHCGGGHVVISFARNEITKGRRILPTPTSGRDTTV